MIEDDATTADAIIGPGALIGEIALITETTPPRHRHRPRADHGAAPVPRHVSPYDGGVSAVGAAPRRRPAPPCHGDVGAISAGSRRVSTRRGASAGPAWRERTGKRDESRFGRDFVRRPFEGLTRPPQDAHILAHTGTFRLTRGPLAPRIHAASHPARLGARPRRHRGSRADQHRQDPSRHRAHARPRRRHDRPAAAPAGARGLHQGRRARRRRASSRWSPARRRSSPTRRATGSPPSRRCRATSTCPSSPSTRSRSPPTSSAATSSPTACSTGAAATRRCCSAPPPCAPIVERLMPGVNVVTRPRLSNLFFAGEKKLTRLPRRTRHRRLLGRRGLRHRRADPPPARRRRRGARARCRRAPATRRSRCTRTAMSTTSSPPTPSAWGSTSTSTTSPSPATANSTAIQFRRLDAGRVRPDRRPRRPPCPRRHLRHDRALRRPFEPELVEAIESHAFDSVKVLQWRNSALDFSSLARLQDSLAATPEEQGLTRAPDSDDMRALSIAARDEDTRTMARGAAAVERLWEVSQTAGLSQDFPACPCRSRHEPLWFSDAGR